MGQKRGRGSFKSCGAYRDRCLIDRWMPLVGGDETKYLVGPGREEGDARRRPTGDELVTRANNGMVRFSWFVGGRGSRFCVPIKAVPANGGGGISAEEIRSPIHQQKARL